MYKHILIPTDGSETADKAVAAGLAFARDAKARVTWLTAVPEYQLPTEADVVSKRFVSPQEHEQQSEQKANAILGELKARAQAMGVECDADYAQSDRPYEAIIKAAQKHGCDLIFMASHGRRGIPALIHGSETRDVLTHSDIPTLVYR
jgi:nucleotide-binding universal stress UspA family protein